MPQYHYTYEPYTNTRRVIPRKHLGRIQVTHDLIKSVLQLPDDVKFNSADVDIYREGIITFVVESPCLPESGEGEVIPIVDIQRLRGFDE